MMFCKYLPLVAILMFATRSTAQAPVFRADYTHSAQWGGFYKVHRYPLRWHDALAVCRAEGAQLATPKSLDQVTLFQEAMTESLIGVVYTGLHDHFSKGHHVTIEGTPLSRLPLNWTENEPDNLDNQENCIVLLREDGGLADENCNLTVPFICYKDGNTKDTIDDGYEHYSQTGSSYKYHRVPQTWHDAYRTCAGEEGYLAVINSPEEARLLVEVFAKHPIPSMMTGDYWKDIILVGFSELLELGRWETVQGELLERSGYVAWEDSQPDHASPDSHCGSMNRNGRYNDYSCGRIGVFICERDPEYAAIPNVNLTTPVY